MVFRKHNSTAGFSLIEVLVAITILGLVVVPIGSILVLSFRLNARRLEKGSSKSSSLKYSTRSCTGCCASSSATIQIT